MTDLQLFRAYLLDMRKAQLQACVTRAQKSESASDYSMIKAHAMTAHHLETAIRELASLENDPKDFMRRHNIVSAVIEEVRSE